MTAPGRGARVPLLLALVAGGLFAGLALAPGPVAADEPVARCQLSTTTVGPGDAVTIDASASEMAELYQYDPSGTGEFGPYRDTASMQFSYDEPGEYVPRVRVLSPNETTDTTECGTVTVVDNQPPSAAFESTPNDLVAGETVSFESVSFDGDGEIVRYVWRVDGERVGEGPTLDYAFESAGEYRVRLTVTDDEGATDLAERGVTVGTGTRTVTLSPTSTPTPMPSTPTPTTSPTPGAAVGAGWWYSPLSPSPGETVSLVATGPDRGVTYEWDVDGDDAFELQGAFVSHGFDRNRTVTLRATGPGGKTATRSERVVVGSRTGASDETGDDGPSFWIAPLNPQPGETVTLVADPGRAGTESISAYRWDLDGDGETDATGRTTSYNFSEDGRAPVQLSIDHSNGTTSETRRAVAVGNVTETPTPAARTTGGSAPGFGPVAAVVALLAALLVAAGRAGQ